MLQQTCCICRLKRFGLKNILKKTFRNEADLSARESKFLRIVRKRSAKQKPRISNLKATLCRLGDKIIGTQLCDTCHTTILYVIILLKLRQHNKLFNTFYKSSRFQQFFFKFYRVHKVTHLCQDKFRVPDCLYQTSTANIPPATSVKDTINTTLEVLRLFLLHLYI